MKLANCATANSVPAEVRLAFEAWQKADKWSSSLTRTEIGVLGAAKRRLNSLLRKHSLTFDEVGKALV